MSVISNNWLTEKNLTFPVLSVELWLKCLSLLLIKKNYFIYIFLITPTTT